MIHKNASIGEAKNVIVAEFGNGTLNLQPSQGVDYNALLIKSQEPHKIGESSSAYLGKKAEEYNPEMALIFRNPESIQVLIDQLEVVKKSFCSKNE